MGTESIDAHSLSLLTDEERAAINDTPSEDEIASLKAVAGAPEDDGEDEVAAAEPAVEAAPAAPAAPAAAAQAEAAPAATPEVTAEPAPQAVAPTYRAELPADFEARKQAVDTKEGDAWAKFEAGEIDRDELQTQLRAVTSEREDLVLLRAKAEVSKDMTNQTAQQSWASAVNAFMATTAKGEGIDYRKDPVRAADLDTFVKALANEPRHDDKPMDWFLKEAHKLVNALHGTPTAAVVKDPKTAVAEAVAARTPSAAAAAKTLATVPGGGGPGDVGSEFANLDALSGDAYEDALAKLSPADRARYARGD